MQCKGIKGLPFVWTVHAVSPRFRKNEALHKCCSLRAQDPTLHRLLAASATLR